MNRKAGLYFSLAGVFLFVAATNPLEKVKQNIKDNIEPLFQRVKVKFHLSRLLKPDLELFFKIRNGNIFGVKDAGFNGQIMYEGVLLGNINSTNLVAIPAKKTSEELKLVQRFSG